MGKAKAGPVVSDNGNFIVDAPFPREMMLKPAEVSSSDPPFLFFVPLMLRGYSS